MLSSSIHFLSSSSSHLKQIFLHFLSYIRSLSLSLTLTRAEFHMHIILLNFAPGKITFKNELIHYSNSLNDSHVCKIINSYEIVEEGKKIRVNSIAFHGS